MGWILSPQNMIKSWFLVLLNVTFQEIGIFENLIKYKLIRVSTKSNDWFP
jgi:hypothetical protein